MSKQSPRDKYCIVGIVVILLKKYFDIQSMILM